MKRIILSFLSTVACISAFAGGDSVTVVLNSGMASRGKLISKSDDIVVVSQGGNEYSFSSQSARVIVTDDGEVLMGTMETQSDYNRKVREEKIKKSSVQLSNDKYVRTELGFSMNELSGDFNTQKYSVTVRNGHRIKDSNLFWDFGASFGFSHNSVSHTDSVASMNNWNNGLNPGSSNPGSSNPGGSNPGGSNPGGSFPGIDPGMGGRTMEAVEKKTNTTIFSIEVPVRLSYHVSCGNLTLAPFAGVIGRYNFYDDVTEVTGGSSATASAGSGSGSAGKSQLKDGEARKFQLAYCAGVELMSGERLSIGLSWQNDLTDYIRTDEAHEKFSGVGMALGIRF